ITLLLMQSQIVIVLHEEPSAHLVFFMGQLFHSRIFLNRSRYMKFVINHLNLEDNGLRNVVRNYFLYMHLQGICVNRCSEGVIYFSQIELYLMGIPKNSALKK